ncbi:MAG: NAD(P)/FAD-dependent oxidoreductase [Thermodesulfobacteriota bacterium]
MHVHTLIIGAGPGGLSCAAKLAEQGVESLVLERKKQIGSKVCAGGITWSGLISRVPETLVEKSFPSQYIRTPLQKVTIEEDKPIIATVNRIKLGQHMADQAKQAGAMLRTNTLVRSIKKNSLLIEDRECGKQEEIHFTNLVGADGSNSLVRRYLRLPCEQVGLGINYMVPGDLKRMEWHLNNSFFANGYGWIFPHQDVFSIGAYADRSAISPSSLKANLIRWAAEQGVRLEDQELSAEPINYDFRGWNFGNIFLIGDAAGLASGLTGEGIYPAIVSGEEVAATIIDPSRRSSTMDQLISRHRKHTQLVTLSGKNGFLNTILSELVTLGLRSGMVSFNKLEMAG